MWALRIAVASAVLGTSSVVPLAHVTVLWHLDKVESTIETAWQLRDINVDSEFPASQFEHLVVALILHHVHTRADVLAVSTLSDEVKLDTATVSGDTIGTTHIILVDAFQGAVPGTGASIRAG